MSEIKSALEIALERTQSVEADPAAMAESKYRTEGKKLVSRFLEDNEYDLTGSLKSYDKKSLAWVKKGMLEVLSANLVLPQDPAALVTVKKLGKAFTCLIRNRRMVDNLFGQLGGFFEEYLAEKDRVRDGMEKQYMPRLRQKQEELSQKLGQPVHIDIKADPEFAEMLRKALAQLDDKYGSALAQAKEQLQSISQSE